MKFLLHKSIVKSIKYEAFQFRRCLTQSCTDYHVKELESSVKRDIESHWKDRVNKGQFDRSNPDEKFYILSMFPYPSGNLHMGHVRVYSISDTMARFYRMNGKNVFHPIGWDAFGLPAENAAIQRNVEPLDWTEENIGQMRKQLQNLGCSFDWSYELSTCHEEYFKWTQHLFLMLYKEGLVYQNEAMVNWDPIDKTVLADEQVDSNGCSWRSGAKVEKKLLRQWFIKTTKFAKSLLDGLSDPTLQDWRDIINLQKHWIGDCNGYAFQLKCNNNDDSHSIRIWTENPEKLQDVNCFVVLRSSHHLRAALGAKSTIYNPITDQYIPIVFSDDVRFAKGCDSYLASPHYKEEDKSLRESLELPFSENHIDVNDELNRKSVLNTAKQIGIGGYQVSSKLQDWLISRQRYWGTPIPMVHCDKCGTVPVDEKDLPVKLPSKNIHVTKDKDSIMTECPKCGSPDARKETDTMDTFVDSSWYFLRYLDSKNSEKIFDEKLVKKCTPVDLYIGGKEHAVLHLYYARFMNHFLHSKDLLSYPEPFRRLLVQGMVMGRSFRLKGSGKYLKEDEVTVIDAKKNKAICKTSGDPVVMTWEKMSKSKMNGVDPTYMITEYGADTTRLITLADVAPTSHRNWSSATFPGVLNWQKRLWLTLNQFHEIRTEAIDAGFNYNDETFLANDEKMFDSRNYYIKGATFNYRHTHQLSVAISKMQGLTNSLRRAPKDVIKYGKHFERALASQIIMLAPMAPHFASELWSKFTAVPHRRNESSEEIQWGEDVLKQKWPKIDSEYKLDLSIKINGFENAVVKIPRSEIDKVTQCSAMDVAFNTDSVTSYLVDKKIRTTNFVLYPGIEAILNIYVDKASKEKVVSEEVLANK